MIEDKLEKLMQEKLPTELFLKENGESMEFCMKIGKTPDSARIVKLTKRLIEKCGGTLICNISAQSPHLIKLLVQGDSAISTTNDFFKHSFIIDCAEKRQLQDLNEYRANKSLFTDDVDVNDILCGLRPWKDAKLCGGVEVSDDEFFSDLPELQQTQKRGKFYSRDEDIKLVRYILQNKLYTKVKGRMMWETLERKKTFCDRPWQSLKERFIKKIIPSLSTFKLSRKDQDRIKLGYQGKPITWDAEMDETDSEVEESIPVSEPKSPSLLKENICNSPSSLEDVSMKEDSDASYYSSPKLVCSPIQLDPSESDIEDTNSKDEDNDIAKENAPPEKPGSSHGKRQISPSIKMSWTKKKKIVHGPRASFTTTEDELIIKFMHDNKLRHKSNGNQIWKIMEKKKIIKGRTWQSLKERYRKRILPNLKKYQSNKSLAKALEYLEGSPASAPCETPPPPPWERKYHRKEDEEILKFIIDNCRYKDVKGRALWVGMGKSFTSKRSWHSLRERFLKVISQNLSKYEMLTNKQKERLQNAAIRPAFTPNSNPHESSDSSSVSETEEAPQRLSPRKKTGETSTPKPLNVPSRKSRSSRKKSSLKRIRQKHLLRRVEIFQDTPLVPNQRSEGIKRLPIGEPVFPSSSSEDESPTPRKSPRSRAKHTTKEEQPKGRSSNVNTPSSSKTKSTKTRSIGKILSDQSSDEIVPPTDSSSEDAFTRLRVTRRLQKMKQKELCSDENPAVSNKNEEIKNDVADEQVATPVKFSPERTVTRFTAQRKSPRTKGENSFSTSSTFSDDEAKNKTNSGTESAVKSTRSRNSSISESSSGDETNRFRISRRFRKIKRRTLKNM